MSLKIKTYRMDDGTYVVSEGGAWIPGVFDSDGAARLAALKLSDAEIIEKLGPVYRVDGENRPAGMGDVAKAIAK